MRAHHGWSRRWCLLALEAHVDYYEGPALPRVWSFETLAGCLQYLDRLWEYERCPTRERRLGLETLEAGARTGHSVSYHVPTVPPVRYWLWSQR